jgi:hypothetical protein
MIVFAYPAKTQVEERELLAERLPAAASGAPLTGSLLPSLVSTGALPVGLKQLMEHRPQACFSPLP